MAQRSKLQDVADAAGVSFITAWRAMNAPDMVRAKTLEKVQAAAIEIGYVANAVARSLVTSQSGVVGIIVPTLEDSIFSSTVQGLSDELTANGVEMLVGISNYNDSREEELIRAFIGRQVDGLVLTGKAHSESARNVLTKSGLAIVEIWDVPTDPLDMYVGFSNTDLAHQATSWLISKGYKNIAFVGPQNRPRAKERQAGYMSAMRDAKLSDLTRTIWSEATIAGGGQAMLTLMAGDTPPDAILFNGDILAIGAHFRGTAMGLRFPNDVALMGVHNTPITAEISPSLSTVHIPGNKIGSLAAKAILERLKDGTSSHSERIEFEIIGRETT